MNAAECFIENYIDKTTGKSGIVYLNELISKYGDMFETDNGCRWGRKGSLVDKKYIFARYNAKQMGVSGVRWNKIVAVEAKGFRETIENHSIPAPVKKELKNKPCSVLGVITSDMEIDHKNGKYDSAQYQASDFQPLTKSVNDAKREHCKRCNASNVRFKATALGYSVDYIKGNESSSFCEGCYWYDPQEFNKVISAGFKKEE